MQRRVSIPFALLILSAVFLGAFFLFAALQADEADLAAEINSSDSGYYFKDKTIEWIIPFIQQ